ncbi:hypothetical protein Tsp_10972 [Trichinella spiralis]|uniref:hypothetical protein n=1 Tax=Trichinella spiralis TaxID=6334 RepID=UPI0001EFBE1D|nr:hypothetical protein Tsp_10972 [Trichinella spiralis]
MLKTKNCGLRHPMKLVPLATLVHMDIKAFPSHPSVPLIIPNSIQITLRQSSSAGASIDISCGLRHPMNLVPFATRVHMDVKALPSRPSVPLLITNSQRRNSIFRSRWQSAFPTVLFFLVTQVRNCEDESRILHDLHRITLCCYCSSSITFYNMASSTLALVRSIKVSIEVR